LAHANRRRIALACRDPFVLLGGAIIVGAATFISHRERMQAKAEITPPALATKI